MPDYQTPGVYFERVDAAFPAITALRIVPRRPRVFAPDAIQPHGRSDDVFLAHKVIVKQVARLKQIFERKRRVIAGGLEETVHGILRG